MVPGQQRAADGLRLGRPPRPREAACLLDQQGVPARIGRVHQASGPGQQAGGGIGRGRHGLPGSLGEPPDRVGVARRRPAGQLLGDLQGRGARRGQPLPGLAVQPEADGAGQVLVDGVADQVVAEPQPGTVIGHHPGPDRAGQRHRQL